MKLYDYFRSSAAYRVRIAINLKGLEVEREYISLREGRHTAAAYRAVNAQGLVPTLVDDDGRTLTQSLAIIEYLDSRHPKPPLLPSDPFARARVRALALIVACDIHPINNLRVLNYLKKELQVSDEDVSGRWYAHWVALGLAAMETQVAETSAAARFCFGDAPSLADCCLVPQLFNADRFNVALKSYPNLLKIWDYCNSLDAFAEAHPDRQRDATG